MIHLHTRSCYSLLEGTMTIGQIVQAAKDNGQSAAVLTDKNSMFATMAFIKECRKQNIKPIIGLELDAMEQGIVHSFILLARNTKGLQDLFRLSTRLMSNKDMLEVEDLKEYVQDCYLLPSGDEQWIWDMASSLNMEELACYFQRLQQLCPNFVPVVSLNDSPKIERINQDIRMACEMIGVVPAAINRVEYLKPGDEETLRLLKAIGHQTQIGDRSLQVRTGRYFRSSEEMAMLYEQAELIRTDEIAASIEEYNLPKASLPVFINKANLPSNEYLRKLCQAGLNKRMNGNIPPAYQKRLDYELDVIVKMGFENYFLIVWDFIREARSRKILVGPGRGSAAGSLVSYVLGISHVDPIEANLLFERFLNPERVSMPDIDTDFPDDRRDEVIEYVQDVYGKGRAAHIVTFATFKARAAIKDAAKALGISAMQADRLSKAVQPGLTVTLKSSYETNRAFASLVDNSRDLQRLYAAALSIEGLPRHSSIHAGGIVLANEDIVAQAPLMDVNAALPAVQFSMEHLEELGLIKFDFLALRNLTTLEAIRQDVRARTGQDIDLLKLPLNDPSVYRLLCAKNTLGIFQLEKEGMKDLIARMKPRCFDDIALLLALYRPGPMQNIDRFLKARFHPNQMESLHPLLDDLLRPTGGIFVYQEQIMEAARIIGGFSLSQADILRKAMSKKNRAEMEKWSAQFVEGAAAKGIEEKKAREIFEVMERFADYGFNKSHSYAYALIVYQMAWLKARYPVSFYLCSLNTAIPSSNKTMQFLQECAQRKLPVHPVSINHSSLEYVPYQKGLIMPFLLLKGLSKASAQALVQERQTSGPFRDPSIAIIRLLHAGLSKAQIQTLIQAGAMDELGINRESLLASFEDIARLSDLVSWSDKTHSLEFAGVSPPRIIQKPVSLMDRLLDEKKIYGFYISRHPAAILRQRNPKLQSTADLMDKNGYAATCGIIADVHAHKTKNGQNMAFVLLQDDAGQIDLAIMPREYEQLHSQLKEGVFIEVEGKKNRPKSILADRIRFIDLNRMG